MQLEQVKSVLKREPFVPLRLVKTDGSIVNIPFRHVAYMQEYHLIVFKGVKHEKSRFASKGFEAINYDTIDRIEPKLAKNGKKNGRHKKGR